MPVNVMNTVIKALLVPFCVAVVWFFAVPAAAVDFLVPGVSIESVSFTPGARVKYLVTSEMNGAIDSSIVELTVVEWHESDVRLEIYSAPVPVCEEEAITIRLLIKRRIAEISSPDELRSCIGEIEVRDGAGEFRTPDDDEIADFELERIFLARTEETVKRALGADTVETVAGSFMCEATELTTESRRAVKLGGIDAERVEREVSTIWMSSDIPFWGMVRSRVERMRETKLLTDRPPARLRPQRTITASILIDYEPGDAQ